MIFADPGTRRYGIAAPNVLQGPGRHNWDLSLFKNIKTSETTRVQLRFEAFNAWNQTNFRNPNMTTTSVDFGTISDSAAPRLVQVGVKFTF